MKIYSSIGSKERLVEMFQQVNKIKLNEDFATSNPSMDVVENAFNQLKNNQLKIQNTNNQTGDNESFVELNCVDQSGTNINFKFRATSSQGEQEGVFNVDTVELIEFTQKKSDGSTFEIDESMLKQFNSQHKDELLEIVSNYVDFDEGKPETDELYEEAIKLIDKVPYNNGTERLQKHKAYADEKPTNSNVRVNSPELNKFVKENDELEPESQDDDPLAMPNDYDSNELEKDLGNSYDDVDKSYMGTLEIGDTEESSPDEQELYNQAFENLMAKNKTSKNPNYFPTRPEIEKEIERLSLNKTQEPEDPYSHMAKGKKRVYPAWADKFLAEVHPYDAGDIQNKYYQNISPEVKNEIIMKASEMLDAHLGVKKYQIPKQEYYDAIKELAKRIYLTQLQVRNESEYPTSMEIPKVIEPKKNYPKEQKKRHKVKKLKVQENDGIEEMSTYKNLNNVDINKHKAVLVHLWSGSPSGVKIALFVPATNKETGERKWMLSPNKSIGFVSYDMVNNPEYAFIEGSAAKEFLKQQGYKIKNDTKVITRLEENDGMSLEPETDNIEQLAQDREEQGDQIKGGLGDDKSPLEFNSEQIKLGMKVEMEHTDDPMIALEIALDHLTENPEYYTVKDDPEASAQANASMEASDEKKPENVGNFMSFEDFSKVNDNENPSGCWDDRMINPDMGMGSPAELAKKMGWLNNDDKEKTDELLGYKPKNVGDMDEEIVGANGAESVVGGQSTVDDTDDGYKKYQEYEKKDFNTLPDNDKEEYFNLWKKYKKNQ
jgi:hypothetical protein